MLKEQRQKAGLPPPVTLPTPQWRPIRDLDTFNAAEASLKKNSQPDAAGPPRLRGWRRATGSDGTITVVDTSGPHIEAVATIRSAVGARSIAADATTGRLYLPTSAFQPSTATGKGAGVDGTLHILVFARKSDGAASKP